MPAPTPVRRARGHYSPLICTRCRARKIKCVLPADVTSPSSPEGTPQPVDKACQRCRQNGFDCIVGQTTLGRPHQQRAASSSAGTVMRTDTSTSTSTPTPAPSTEGFLLSRPYSDANDRIPPSEVCEALSTPLRFLAVLLGRHPGFAQNLPYPQALTGREDILNIVQPDHLEELDSRCVYVCRPCACKDRC